MGGGLTADGILMVVEGDENVGGLAEMLGGGVPGEDKFPDKEIKVHEGMELDRSEVVGALCVFAGPEAEVEANGDQASNVVGSRFRGASCRGEYGVHDYQGSGLFSLDGGILLRFRVRRLLRLVCP